MSQRIGFVDFNLENFHADVYLKLLRGELATRGFDVAGATALEEEPSKVWADKNDVPYYDSIEELDAQVDFYAVLAPSNPEVHEALCRRVFPCAKPTYVDKTFAPDLAAAERIFALADEYGVAMQSSSALRYTNVQHHLAELVNSSPLHMVTWGGGSSFAEYAIHPLELAISCMGADFERLVRRGHGDFNQLFIEFSRGRTAAVNIYTNTSTPFAAALTTGQGTEYLAVDSSAIFRDTAAAMLDLFASGQTSIDRRETLVIRHILDAAETTATRTESVEL
ncbi:MAG: Gfo/Idh/MocA family oxidoreductase [Candidatus Latescibacterota bacterium]|jgi:predicted dehydrogenase